MEPGRPALGVWSLSHWSTREAPSSRPLARALPCQPSQSALLVTIPEVRLRPRLQGGSGWGAGLNGEQASARWGMGGLGQGWGREREAPSGNSAVAGVGAGWEGRSRRTGGHRGREVGALTPGGQAGKRGQLLRRASTPSEAEEDRATPAPQGNVAMPDWRESHFYFERHC